VRLQLQHEGAQLKGAMWSLRGNTWNLSPERQEVSGFLCVGRFLYISWLLQKGAQTYP
jgi:hypothetical protein